MTALKILAREKTTTINLKMTAKEKAELERKAKLYANGNLSAWLRYAGLHLVPSKKELK